MLLRRSFVGLFVLAVIWTVSLQAQIKKVEPINAKPKIVDINSAPESEIAAVGIEKAVAKKIVESRPFRNKRELVSRDLLTMEQYDKVKDQLVAKQPPKK